jgi:hypothetical protein
MALLGLLDRRGRGETGGRRRHVVVRAGGVHELGARGEVVDRQPSVDRRLAQQRERDVTVGIAGEEGLWHAA